MIGGFTLLEDKKRKWGSVPEDSIKYEEDGDIYLAVADGVTRDSFNVFPNMNSESGRRLYTDNYPKPSIAKEAADVAVESKDLHEANKRIKKLNDKKVPDPDWLKNDLAGCTAALVKINESVLQYQFIASCGVSVINSDGSVKFQTPDEYWSTDEERWNLVKQAGFVKSFLDSVGHDHKWWWHPEGRLIMRRMFRNKPKQKYSFGVLTGEKEAEEYIREGKMQVSEGDVVIVYSDGLRSALLSKEGLRLISRKNFSKLEEFCRSRVDSEGSVVYWTK